MNVIASSRPQALLYRLTKLATSLLPLGITALLVQLGPLYRDSLLREGMAMVVIGAGVSLWLLVFNRGKLALPEAEFSWDHEGFRYTRFSETTYVPWSDFRGYRLTWGLPPRLRIKRASGPSVVVDHFAFSKEQRDELRHQLLLRGGAA